MWKTTGYIKEISLLKIISFRKNPWKRESGDVRLFCIFFFHFFWDKTLEKGNLEVWDCCVFFLAVLLGHNPWERESAGVRLLCFFLAVLLGHNPWERESGGLRLLCFFSCSSFGSQPLRKGIWRFEIAVGVFFLQFFWVATLGKGNLEVWDCCGYFLPIILGHNPWERESWGLRLLCVVFFLPVLLGHNPWERESGGLRLLWVFFFLQFFWVSVWIYVAVQVQSTIRTFKCHIWTEALTVILSSSNVPQ